jgi:hypothetical protein
MAPVWDKASVLGLKQLGCRAQTGAKTQMALREPGSSPKRLKRLNLAMFN